MRNYIILNDVNSNTINGLLIQELPPISKPKMRTQIEEIDGRAGDIVTQLGYAAYTKTISVGLYGDFDINEVISYFNSSGTVVFSNEPDKYYNYEIIDQIDFNRLVRFRTAKVKMHVQPFKYPTEEEPLVAQYQLVTNTGSDMSLNNTANALFRKLDLKGNTSQTGTPTPDAPIPVNVVSGDNEINICGKNLFTTGNGTSSRIGVNATYNGSEVVLNGTTTSAGNIFYDETISINTGYRKSQKLPAGTYTLSTKTTGTATYPSGIGIAMYIRDGSGNILKSFSSIANYQTTLTINNETEIYSQMYINGSGGVYNNYSIYIQIEKGSTATTYEPYIGNTYPIYLGVENLFDKDNVVSVSITSKYYAFPTPLNAGTYTFSSENTASKRIRIFTGKTYDASTYTDVLNWNVASSITFTTSDYINRIQINSGSEIILDDWKIKLTKGDHLQYITDTPIELCKIGTYQDYIYKDNGSWYLHKEIGKVVLDGSENWSTRSSGVGQLYEVDVSSYNLYSTTTLSLGLSNQYISNVNLTSDNTFRILNGSTLAIHNDTIGSLASFKSGLSTNNLIIYYPLATPTNTEITDTTLIEQLEEIKSANSYEGQTNINHDSNDAPFLVDVSAVQSGTDELVVDNEGNIYSRPTLDIEGTGMVNVYLEGNQMFQVDLSENNEIVIDTDEMEAYDPSTQALMNRQVTGNYDNFKIVAGNNNLKFSGDLTKATVTGYVRWL